MRVVCLLLAFIAMVSVAGLTPRETNLRLKVANKALLKSLKALSAGSEQQVGQRVCSSSDSARSTNEWCAANCVLNDGTLHYACDGASHWQDQVCQCSSEVAVGEQCDSPDQIMYDASFKETGLCCPEGKAFHWDGTCEDKIEKEEVSVGQDDQPTSWYNEDGKQMFARRASYREIIPQQKGLEAELWRREIKLLSCGDSDEQPAREYECNTELDSTVWNCECLAAFLKPHGPGYQESCSSGPGDSCSTEIRDSVEQGGTGQIWILATTGMWDGETEPIECVYQCWEKKDLEIIELENKKPFYGSQMDSDY